MIAHYLYREWCIKWMATSHFILQALRPPAPSLGPSHTDLILLRLLPLYTLPSSTCHLSTPRSTLSPSCLRTFVYAHVHSVFLSTQCPRHLPILYCLPSSTSSSGIIFPSGIFNPTAVVVSPPVSSFLCRRLYQAWPLSGKTMQVTCI